MAHEGTHADQDRDSQAAAGTTTDNCHSAGEARSSTRHSDSQDTRQPPPGIVLTRSISPGMPCPETVLVAAMADGSYLLMAYPQREPAALLTRNDAGPLRHALTAAFHSPRDKDADTAGQGPMPLS